MNRLTEYSVVAGRKVGDLKVGVYELNAFHKLARYEDTGLMPEEVEAMKVAMMGKSVAEVKEFCGIPIEKMVEIAEAYRGGRCMVLPCRVGETIWMVTQRRSSIARQYYSFVKRSELTWFNMRRCVEEFGKTVFLTQEEAEAALRGELG